MYISIFCIAEILSTFVRKTRDSPRFCYPQSMMLIVKNLSCSIDARCVLEDISFSLAPGTVSLMCGQNGSGKSTLVGAVMGLPYISCTAGTITYGPHDVHALSLEQRARAGIFLGFQNPPALPGVMVHTFFRELLLQRNYKPEDCGARIAQVLEMVGLPGVQEKYVHDTFSGGEKKRLELAQMLLLEPSIVLLDEIDSGLDGAGVDMLARIIREYLAQHPKSAIVLVTHRFDLAEKISAARVYTLSEGRLI